MDPEIAALADALAQALAGRPAHERIAALARAAAIAETARPPHARLACLLPAAPLDNDEDYTDPGFGHRPDPIPDDAGSLLVGLSLGIEDPYVDVRLDPPFGADPSGEICITRRPGRFDVDLFDADGDHILGVSFPDGAAPFVRP